MQRGIDKARCAEWLPDSWDNPSSQSRLRETDLQVRYFPCRLRGVAPRKSVFVDSVVGRRQTRGQDMPCLRSAKDLKRPVHTLRPRVSCISVLCERFLAPVYPFFL